MNESVSDEELMAAYIAGNRRAFEGLFARFASPIYRFFTRSFPNASIADDLLQTTFMKLHRARSSYDPTRPLRPWVFAIAARVRLDALRQRHRLPEHCDEDQIDRAEASRAEDDDPLQTAIDRQDRGAIVRAAIERLPETQRVVLHLHRYEDMTFSQIAEVLGTTEGAVKLRAFRAYERLREELRPLVEGPREEGA